MGGEDRVNVVGARLLACTLKRIRICNFVITNISFLTHFITILFFFSVESFLF